ncbi:zinc-ribbon domain-containing protein [Candidatus Woesearchaeota archaeon]|nr:zinc-ribbon domain-containing protein [Candidatus Woesearchaeota archaeon]MBT6505258.1 zinc-ribbon domain-containing protein [Candidatus Woesearchaeota archaeon]
MYCTKCGNELKQNYKFCTRCGTKNKYFKSNVLKAESNKITYKENIVLNSEEQNSSYFKKHWLGQLSLAKSYWINNVLFNAIFALIILLITKNINFTNNPTIPAFFMVILWISILIITPWILIGLWRSANNHIKKYNNTFWATIVKILVVLGWIQSIILYINSGIPQIIEFSKIALNKDSLPQYEIRILNKGKELEISGGIKFGLTNEVERYFKKYPNIKILHLNSIGGRISEAKKLSRIVKNKNITTYTSTGCYSACIDIFIAGKYRFINKNADLGFHQPSFPGMDASDLNSEIAKQEQFYINQGTKKDFIKKAFSTPNNDLWKPSHFELLQANVITKVVDGSKFAVTDLYFWQDIKKLESSLLKIPLYQTIKIYEPKQFAKIVNIINSSVKDGENRIKMFSKTRKIAQSLYLKYLPYSSNKALLNTTKLMIDEMKTLYEQDPIVCYNFSMGKLNNFNPNKYFTKELLKRELNSMNEVIKTGASQPQKIPKEKEIEEIMTKLYLDLYKKIGKDVLVLDKMSSPNVNKKIASKITIKLYEEILKLKSKEKILLLRFIFGRV